MPKISELNEITSLYANDYFAVAHDLNGLPSTKKITAENLATSLSTLSTSGGNGYTGSQGDAGPIGYTGSQGDPGDLGYTGSAGAFAGMGYTGSKGETGYIGSHGVTGSTGLKGDLGYTGSQGDTGYTGSSGASVYMGYTGSAGYTGSLGAIGYTGSFGPTGGTFGQVLVSSGNGSSSWLFNPGIDSLIIENYTTTYTASNTDNYIFCDPNDPGSITVILPSSPPQGKEYNIKNLTGVVGVKYVTVTTDQPTHRYLENPETGQFVESYIIANRGDMQSWIHDGNVYRHIGSQTGVPSFITSANAYTQVVVKNSNSGNNASGDIVVYSDTADYTVGNGPFIDLGIDSSTYSNAEFTLFGPNDAYVYTGNTNLLLGTSTGNTSIKFFAGNTNAEDLKLTITDSTIIANTNFIPSQANAFSLGNSTFQWNELYVSSNAVYIDSVALTTGSGNSLRINSTLLDMGPGGYTGSQGEIGYTGSSGSGSSLGNLQVGGTNNDTLQNISGTGNVVIGSAYLWNFDYSGNLNQPIGSYIKSSSVASIGNAPITVLQSDIVDGPDTNTWVDLPNAAPYTNIQAGWIINSSDVIAPQLITATQVVNLGGGSFTYRVSGFPSYYSSIDYPLTFNDPTYLPAATAALSVAADSNTWVFNSNGSLSFPDTSTQYTAFNNNYSYSWSANQTFLNPTTFSNAVYLTSINANNSFGTSGQVLTTNSTNGLYWSNATATSNAATLTGNTLSNTVKNSNLTSVGTLTNLTVTGNVTSTSGKFIGDGSLLTNLNVTQQANIVGSQANVTLIAGNYSYVFDNTSTFTMPANGDIVLPGVSANLSVGGTITVGGNIIMQNRPAFRVYGSGTMSNLSTTQNGNGILNINNFAVDYNQGSALNTSTGIFTAPIAGLYNIHLVARITSNSSGQAQITVVKNNGLGSQANQVMWEIGPNPSVNHFGVSTIAKLAVGDTLVLKVTLGTINFDANDNWSVAFIG